MNFLDTCYGSSFMIFMTPPVPPSPFPIRLITLPNLLIPWWIRFLRFCAVLVGTSQQKKYEWVIDSVDFWVFIIITSMRRHNVMMLSRERTTISINIPKWSSATANYLQHFDTIYLCYTMLCILLYFLAIST